MPVVDIFLFNIYENITFHLFFFFLAKEGILTIIFYLNTSKHLVPHSFTLVIDKKQSTEKLSLQF